MECVQALAPLQRDSLIESTAAERYPLRPQVLASMRQSSDALRMALFAALLLAARVTRVAQAQSPVMGRVTDQALSPVGNAEVEIRGLNARTRTDSIGRFHFRAVPPGLQRVDVRRLGFAPAFIEVQVPEHDSVVVQFTCVWYCVRNYCPRCLLSVR